MTRGRTAAGLAALLALAAGGCRSSTGPAYDAAAGSYALVAVDGAPLPAALGPGDCPETVVEGELGLTPQVQSRRPLYSVYVLTQRPCAPPRPPARGAELVLDNGRWFASPGRVRFESGREFGAYAARVEATAPGGAPGPAITLRFGGRAFAFRRTRLPPD